jgi:hypothetical protein
MSVRNWTKKLKEELDGAGVAFVSQKQQRFH